MVESLQERIKKARNIVSKHIDKNKCGVLVKHTPLRLKNSNFIDLLNDDAKNFTLQYFNEQTGKYHYAATYQNVLILTSSENKIIEEF